MSLSGKKDPAAPAMTVVIGLAALAYFVLVVVSHERVSLLYLKVFNMFGRTAMESSMHLASLLMGAGVVAASLLILKGKGRFSPRMILLWAALIGSMILADTFLVVTNIERIHYIQYAILSILIRTVLPDNYLALFLTVIAGVADELCQYVWAPHYTKYLDFNDFVLNLLGGFLGILVFLSLFSGEERVTTALIRARRVIYTAVGFALLVACTAVLTGRVVSYHPPDERLGVVTEVAGREVFVLSFVEHPGFWTRTDYGRRYHVLSPLEGILLLSMLLFGYRYLLKGNSQHARRRVPRSKITLISFPAIFHFLHTLKG